jgi:hypothetical protein
VNRRRAIVRFSDVRRLSGLDVASAAGAAAGAGEAQSALQGVDEERSSGSDVALV